MEPEAYVEMATLEESHWWYAGMRTITGVLLDQELSPGNASLILDAGCGTGANLGALTSSGRAYGIDYSGLALDFASRAHPQQVVRGSVTALPYSSGVFDLVTSFDVIYHQAVDDDQQAITEFARVVQEGGLVLIRVPALEALRGAHDLVVHGARRYTDAQLRQQIQETDLQVIRSTYANSFLLPVVYLSRLLEKRRVSRGEQATSDVGKTPSLLVNAVLGSVMRLEAALIRLGLNLPLGVSLFVLARKPAAEGLIS